MPRAADLGLDETQVSQALKDNKGDLILTHQVLGVSFGRLHMFIRCIPSLRRLVKEIERMKLEDQYDQLSNDQFRDEINARTMAYELDGLDTIHELATREHGENASMAQVRLAAAIQLRGPQTSHQSGMAGILEELNAAYLATASRVKGLRANATIHLSLESPQDERIAIPHTPSAS
jgi:hypothetical protein